MGRTSVDRVQSFFHQNELASIVAIIICLSYSWFQPILVGPDVQWPDSATSFCVYLPKTQTQPQKWQDRRVGFPRFGFPRFCSRNLKHALALLDVTTARQMHCSLCSEDLTIHLKVCSTSLSTFIFSAAVSVFHCYVSTAGQSIEIIRVHLEHDQSSVSWFSFSSDVVSPL